MEKPEPIHIYVSFKSANTSSRLSLTSFIDSSDQLFVWCLPSLPKLAKTAKNQYKLRENLDRFASVSIRNQPVSVLGRTRRALSIALINCSCDPLFAPRNYQNPPMPTKNNGKA